MNMNERETLYASVTGLPLRSVRAYRQKPVSAWTKTADRKIGSSVRALERLAQDDDLSWGGWRSAVRAVLREVRDFLAGVFESVASFAERMRDVFVEVLAALKAFLTDETVREVLRIAGGTVSVASTVLMFLGT